MPKRIVSSEERELLDSGLRPSSDPKHPLGQSVTVCEKPECRKGVEFIR